MDETYKYENTVQRFFRRYKPTEEVLIVTKLEVKRTNQ